MKILLLNPPTFDGKSYIREGRCTQEQGIWAALWPPVSLATAAAVLIEDGHEAVVLDCAAERIGVPEFSRRLRELSPGAVFWSTGTPSITSDLRLAAMVKEAAPGAWAGVFGTHVTALDTEVLAGTPALDGVIRNEPEHTIRDVVRALDRRLSLAQVLGVTFRDGAGIRRNPDRPFIPDLDVLPMPAWELVNLASYRLPLNGSRFLIVAPLRGCPYSCSFCTAPAYYGHRLRRRSTDKVIEEIERGINRFGVRHFFFWADTFVLDKAYVRELCEKIIARGLDIAWASNSRADTVDPELLRLMARAGCWMLSFGIESSSQEVLDLAQKKLRVEQVGQSVRWAKEAGIQVAGHFIFGLPGETSESLERTTAFARELDVDFAQFYCAVPYPGTPLHETAVKAGWIQSGDFDSFKQEKSVMSHGSLSAQDIMSARDRAHRGFYFRPKSFWRAFRNSNLTDLPWLYTCLKRFFRDHFAH